MKKVNIKKISKKGKVFILAYDQGMEHGPTEFNDENVDPSYIIDIANKLKVTGIAVQKGIAEKYRKQIKVPLILKLNGKTNLLRGDPVSYQLCSVKEAIALKAAAVGYTIYIGSLHEEEMMKEFSKIQEEAHAAGLPVLLWAYPRGQGTEGKTPEELLAYSARVALELGADMVKLQPAGNESSLKWAVKAAGKTKVLFAGGSKVEESQVIETVKSQIALGASGIAIGRNIWKSSKPIEVGKALMKIVLK